MLVQWEQEDPKLQPSLGRGCETGWASLEWGGEAVVVQPHDVMVVVGTLMCLLHACRHQQYVGKVTVDVFLAHG